VLNPVRGYKALCSRARLWSSAVLLVVSMPASNCGCGPDSHGGVLMQLGFIKVQPKPKAKPKGASD